jgi:bacteriocin-like protein
MKTQNNKLNIELTDEELNEVVGGLNPQPEPPMGVDLRRLFEPSRLIVEQLILRR